MAELLARIGVHPTAARIMICLADTNWTDSTTIQRRCDLRPPEVSTAMRGLVMREAVEMQPDRKGTRGRPRHLYRLADTLENVIQPFVEDANARLHDLEQSLNLIENTTERLIAGARLREV